LRNALRGARLKRFKQFGLSVGATDNPKARALYERLGFEDAGVGTFKEGSDYIDKDGNTKHWEEICIYMLKIL
jgi:hypothetical protein